jgi:hypothetical protein
MMSTFTRNLLALSPTRLDVLSGREIAVEEAEVKLDEKLRDLSKDDRNEHFDKAVSLLENNVVVLCVRSGLRPTRLWPSKCMLLNLWELHKLALSVCTRCVDYAALFSPL